MIRLLTFNMFLPFAHIFFFVCVSSVSHTVLLNVMMIQLTDKEMMFSFFSLLYPFIIDCIFLLF